MSEDKKSGGFLTKVIASVFVAIIAPIAVTLGIKYLAPKEDKPADSGNKGPVINITLPDSGKTTTPVAKDTPKKETPVVPPREGKSETIVPFNGKDLDGWEGHEDLWSAKDGVIIARNTKPIDVSTYLVTKQKFMDFRLTAKVKLVESEMHSGIAFWGRVAPDKGDKYTYAGHLVMFPSGWGMYDLYGRNSLPVDGGPAKKVGKQHDWNDLEILAQGNRVRVAVNGVAVVDWRDPQPERIKEAPIGLQLHSNKDSQEVQFKDLKITTFPAEVKLITVK